MVVKPSILTSFKWKYVFLATMGHMVASGDVGSKWKPTHEFKLERVSRAMLDVANQQVLRVRSDEVGLSYLILSDLHMCFAKILSQETQI